MASTTAASDLCVYCVEESRSPFKNEEKYHFTVFPSALLGHVTSVFQVKMD